MMAKAYAVQPKRLSELLPHRRQVVIAHPL